MDNIQRHLMLRKKDFPARKAAVIGVKEIFMPVLGATLAIIVSFLPMFFISGMMGPYMAPMAANVPLDDIPAAPVRSPSRPGSRSCCSRTTLSPNRTKIPAVLLASYTIPIERY
ncbi:MAG: hypothetical protein U5N86_00450 [Planctomycetota bacterium]|nr:hypothetical protein [Planctomycetota bacterium]